MTTPIDRNALHQLMWDRRDRRNTYLFKQGDFSKEVGCTIYTMSRIIQEFIRAGRIKPLKSYKDNVKSYIIRDPEGYRGTSSSRENGS